MRRIIAGTLIAGAVAAATPIVPVEMRWVLSYETVAFDTPDGDLGTNEYAVKNDKEWYIREVPKSKGNFTSTTTEPVGKKLVKIRARKSPTNQECTGCAYYAEFAGRDGEVKRYATTKEEYDGGRYVRNYPQPKKSERVSVLSANTAEAAIAFDAANGAAVDASSASFSITTSGTERFMVGVAINDTGDDLATMTYNSVAFTPLIDYDQSGVGPTRNYLRYLIAPDSGANTFAITWSDESDSCAMVSTYTGVDQTSPIDDFESITDASTPFTSGTFTTTVANDYIVIAAADSNDAANARSISGTGTERQDALCGSGAGDYGRWMGDRAATVAGNYTVAFNSAGGDGDDSNIVGVAFKESGGAPPASTPPVVEDFWDDL